MGAPDTIVSQTDPNTQPRVTSRIVRRRSPGDSGSAGKSLSVVKEISGGRMPEGSCGLEVASVRADTKHNARNSQAALRPDR